MKTQTNNRKIGFHIDMSCPACGGGLSVGDDYFILDCHHCSTVHRLIQPDAPTAYLALPNIDDREARFVVDRYLKTKNLPLTEDDFQVKKVYYPFWKIDAVVFRLRKSKITTIVIPSDQYTEDVTRDKVQTEFSLSPYSTTLTAGCQFDGIPPTLGQRSDYIKLTPFFDDKIPEGFHSYPVMKSWDDIRGDLLGRLAAVGNIASDDFGVNKTELFAPKASLVYFPFLIFEDFNELGFNRFVVDCITGRMIKHITKMNANSDVEPASANIKFGSVKVEPHRCSNCGEGLPSKQSYLYICRNCETKQFLGSARYHIGEIGKVVYPKDPDVEYFPFWSMKMSQEDIKRLGPHFGGIFKSDHLVIPAFKVKNFNAIYRLSKRMSAATAQLDIEPLYKTNIQFKPVDLSYDEAMMNAEIFIFRSQQERGSSKQQLSTPFIPTESSLFYAPFKLENYFYIDSVLEAVSFEKQILL